MQNNASSGSPRISRRRFTGLVGKSTWGGLALGVAGSKLGAAAKETTKKAATPAGERRGVWKTTHSPKALSSPASTPPGETWRYLLAYPFQVAPRIGALALNIKPHPGPGQDFPCGIDILLFDDFRNLHPEQAIPITRNHEENNPNADNKPAFMAKTPAQIGFIPWGAKRADGSPHPHAGTGFALTNATARPVDDSEGTVNFPDRVGRSAFSGARAYDYFERFQLSYDGTVFKVTEKESLRKAEVVDGYQLIGRGMGAAIPDGDDLLVPMQAIKPGAAKYGTGLSRWKRLGGRWKPVTFTLITPEDNSLEPTIVRDVDGSVLFLGRARRDAGPPIRIWRQAPGAERWDLIINRNGLTNSTPVTLNSAVDGTPYVLMNFHQPEFRLPPGVHSDGGISRIEPKGWRGERSTICLLALNDARDGFETPLIVKDPLVEYGQPPHGTIWAADHATGTVLRLGDGQWHSIFGYRLLEWIENTHFKPPSPQTGCYVDEVISIGPPLAPWNF